MSASPLRIALLGYGKMGRAVESVARDRGHAIVAIIDPAQGSGPDILETSGAQVAIDFSTGDAVLANVRAASAAKVDMVLGTTGWSESLTEAKQLVDRAGTAMIHAPNFAIGVHIFRKIVTQAAALVDRIDLYDVRISEVHHEHKLDAPSGTAIQLAEVILARLKSKDSWQAFRSDDDHEADPRQLPVSSTRSGETPGTHVVSFEGALDRIELKHEALDRSVFAQGAVLAAEWVQGRKGTFTIDDLFSGEGT
jgi:4-hydroxy-tetrahydrodipicolinate reductase